MPGLPGNNTSAIGADASPCNLHFLHVHQNLKIEFLHCVFVTLLFMYLKNVDSFADAFGFRVRTGLNNVQGDLIKLAS